MRIERDFDSGSVVWSDGRSVVVVEYVAAAAAAAAAVDGFAETVFLRVGGGSSHVLRVYISLVEE